MSTLEQLGIKPNAKLFTQHCADGTERWLTMTTAYDLTAHPKNYGIHGSELIFGIRRGKVVVSLRWLTPFYLPGVRKKLESKGADERLFDGLGSIDYHLPVPTYEGQIAVHDCEYTGGDCYCDGSALAASELFDKAVAEPGQIWITLLEWLEEAERKVKAEIENARNLS